MTQPAAPNQHQQTNSQQQEPPLTPRELQVVEFVALQKSDKQIGYQLGIRPSTVKNYTASARLKIKVQTRVGLALWYAQHFGFPPVVSEK